MPKEPDQEKIREKTRAGLTREQAIDVLERQAEYDAQINKPEKKSGK